VKKAACFFFLVVFGGFRLVLFARMLLLKHFPLICQVTRYFPRFVCHPRTESCASTRQRNNKKRRRSTENASTTLKTEKKATPKVDETPSQFFFIFEILLFFCLFVYSMLDAKGKSKSRSFCVCFLFVFL